MPRNNIVAGFRGCKPNSIKNEEEEGEEEVTGFLVTFHFNLAPVVI